MKLDELYALTVVGLRKWPRGKHSHQELIVSKDPIKNPIKLTVPTKSKPLFSKLIRRAK